MRSGLLALLAAVLIACAAADLTGQTSRAELLERGRQEFETSARFEHFARAASPALGPLDSLWAASVYETAQSLLEDNLEEVAVAWLNWKASVTSDWAPDPDSFLPRLTELYERARSEAEDRPPPDPVTTELSWEWGGSVPPSGAGILFVDLREPDGLRVSVDGRAVAPGADVRLAPGPHRLSIRGQGFDPIDLTAYLLPGVKTRVDVRPIPRLAFPVRRALERSLWHLSASDPEHVCAIGFDATEDGLVLTARTPFDHTELLTGVRVIGGSGVDELKVHARGSEGGIAVLDVGAAESRPLSAAGPPSPGSPAWTAYRSSCDQDVEVRPVRLTEEADQGWVLVPAMPEASFGAPVVDTEGALLGVLAGPSLLVPSEVAHRLAVRQRSAVVASIDPATETSGGGFRWRWVGLGIAALAGGYFAFSGGAEPSGPTPGVDQPGPTPKGGVVIRWGG